MASETREVTVKIRAHAPHVSEATLTDHLTSLLREMKRTVEGMADHDWNRKVMVDWEESEAVELEIKLEADLT